MMINPMIAKAFIGRASNVKRGRRLGGAVLLGSFVSPNEKRYADRGHSRRPIAKLVVLSHPCAEMAVHGGKIRGRVCDQRLNGLPVKMLRDRWRQDEQRSQDHERKCGCGLHVVFMVDRSLNVKWPNVAPHLPPPGRRVERRNNS
jgi:hypothetical protein